MQKNIHNAVQKSFEFEFAITKEVNNPFGYSRQLVQDTLGDRRKQFLSFRTAAMRHRGGRAKMRDLVQWQQQQDLQLTQFIKMMQL